MEDWVVESAADARIFLGIAMEEFLGLTPRYLARLFERLKERRRIDGELFERMTAHLIAMVANTGFRGWKEPRTPMEFMPSLRNRQGKLIGKKQTRKQRLAESWARYYANREAFLKQKSRGT